METLLVYSVDSYVTRAISEMFKRSFVVRDVAEQRWALSILANEMVAAIIIDCAIGNATTVCVNIRQHCYQPLLAIATGHTMEERIALVQAGANDVLVRPVTSAALRVGIYRQLQAQPAGSYCATQRRMPNPPAIGIGVNPTRLDPRFISTQTQRRIVRFGYASLDA